MLWMIVMFFWVISYHEEASDIFKGTILTIAVIDVFIEFMGITYFIYTFLMV